MSNNYNVNPGAIQLLEPSNRSLYLQAKLYKLFGTVGEFNYTDWAYTIRSDYGAVVISYTAVGQLKLDLINRMFNQVKLSLSDLMKPLFNVDEYNDLEADPEIDRMLDDYFPWLKKSDCDCGAKKANSTHAFWCSAYSKERKKK